MSRYKGFSTVKLASPQRSVFDLSHQKPVSTQMGRLTPVLNVETLPGDVFRGSTEMLVRLAPMLAPIYDQIQVFVHFFFVPYRLLWSEWETFITGGRLGPDNDNPAPIPPFIDIGEVGTLFSSPNIFGTSTLADYLGVPVLPVEGVISDYNGLQLDIMPFVGYQLIWYEYYRDRNYLPDEMFTFPVASGEMAAATFGNFGNLRIRDYMKDYFTSALPFVQRGDEVLMPVTLQGYAPVVVDPVSPPTTTAQIDGTEDATPVAWGVDTDEDVPVVAGQNVWARFDDSTIGSASSINDFRAAYALQVWLERNAVGGSRYTESIQAHFAVRPQDYRLQRPEYIGGGRIPVKISEVVSTAWSLDGEDNSVPVGNQSGRGISYGNINRFKYFCTEHGMIYGIASIMNAGSYHQGLPRMFRRRSFLDYVWPTFAKLGAQQVDKAELYASAANLTADVETGLLPLFGYQDRYSDWKYIPNSVHGDFHTSLKFWTLVREFADSPELGAEFVNFDPTTADRIFAVAATVSATDNFWLYVNNKLTVKRCLPYFGTPNTLGFS